MIQNEFLMLPILPRVWLVLFSLSMILALLGCGGASPAPFNGGSSLSPVTVTISPTRVNLTTGTMQTFSATVSNTGMTTVTWLVDGIAGGNSAFGIIDKDGNYTAPPFVPIPPTVTITAVANADNTKFANAAAAISGSPFPGSVSVSPTTANLYLGGNILFKATVNGRDKRVNWLVNGILGGDVNTVGTISPLPCSPDEAIYVAPLQIFGAGAVTVSAESLADPTQVGSGVVNLSSPKGGAVVTITNPIVPPTVPAGSPQAFQASVTGVSDTSVIWEVDGISGGNSCVGTIAPGANDIATYTAPLQVPNPSQVIVTAVSHAQKAASASMIVNIVAAEPITVAVTVDTCTNPQAVPIPPDPQSTAQFTASVSGTADQSVTWQVDQITGGNDTVGTISTSGLYVAPAVVPNPQTVTVSAVSNADPSVVGNLPITIVSAPVPLVTISPQQATVQTHSGKAFTATVTGMGLTNTAVSWDVNNEPGGDPTIGTVSGGSPSECQTQGNYTAPDTVPNPPQVQVTAISTTDSTKFASATVTITNSPTITVHVSPKSVPVVVGQTQPFQASVDGTQDKKVSWSLSGQGCSGTACGTINPTSDSTANYIAPNYVPNPPTVNVTATADADRSAHDSGVVTIEQNAQPSIAIYPSSTTLAAGSQGFNFSAVITNAPQNSELQWQLGCISLWDGDPGENCNDADFDGDGPGCTEVSGNPFKVCGERPNGGPGNDPLTYFAPGKLFTNKFETNVCTPNGNDGTGWLPLTVTMNNSQCPQGICEAQACIQIVQP